MGRGNARRGAVVRRNGPLLLPELFRLVNLAHRAVTYATSAAARKMPAYRIQSHTRHKSAQMVAGYIREADKWTKSGLDGVEF